MLEVTCQIIFALPLNCVNVTVVCVCIYCIMYHTVVWRTCIKDYC